jgi:hypothetical protein
MVFCNAQIGPEKEEENQHMQNIISLFNCTDQSHPLSVLAQVHVPECNQYVAWKLNEPSDAYATH